MIDAIPPTIRIGSREIGVNKPVFLIAEAGINHNNELKKAYRMVDEAIKAGVDAIKFQTFVADEIQLRNSVKPAYQNRIKRKSYYEIIKELEPILEDQIKIKNYCKKQKIIFLSTPYDKKSVDFLDKVGVTAFKIAASDLTNHILLAHILKKGKPIILSTGLSSIKEVDLAVRLIKKFNMKNKLILVQTTSDYPTNNNEVNLRVIRTYSKRYGVNVGFSDHTKDHTASIGAVALGASVVEKHFTLNRNLPGPDQSSSLEPSELRDWVRRIRLIEQSMGSFEKFISHSERRNLSMRKILVIHAAKKNAKVTIDLIDAMRGTKDGILPVEDNIKFIIGKRLTKDITTTRQFSWNMIR